MRNYGVTNNELTWWAVFWSPTGKVIATVRARTEREAKRKAPLPYRKFLGELYALPRLPKKATCATLSP